MNPITHYLASWTLGDAAGCSRRDRACVTWCGVLPDADGLGAVADTANGILGRPESWYFWMYHHTVFHGLPAAILLPAVLSLFAVDRVRVFLVGCAAVHLHLLCDLVGSHGPTPDDIWPIHYLAPLSDAASFAWKGQWALNAWPNIAITVLLLMLGFRSAVRSGYSPVEVLSRQADRVFVGTVRHRWDRLRGNTRRPG